MTVFEGNTVAAAIAAGLKQLHRTRDQVTVEVIAEAKKGFLGLGKQPAQVKITAVPASTAAASATEQPQSAETTDQSAAPQRPATSSAPASAETSPAKSIVTLDVSTGPVVPGDAGLADETDASTDATQHSGNVQPTEVQDVETKVSAAGRPQAGVETETTTKVAATKAVNTQDADHQTNGKAAKSAAPKAKPAKAKAAHDAAATTPTPRTSAEIAARQAANETAIRDLSAYLLEVVKQLGIAADLDVDFGNRYATLNFNTAKQGLLIGKHGRTINALQDLAQVYMNHHGASHVNVVLDVDDYRDRRVATLKRLAESTAREVIATGKQVFLDPMPSFERKLIHAELANNHHVTTFSEGREPHRAVVVAIRK
ncbi:protein jag [Lactiplantibacillus pentosus]|uniref:RNA-binding protein KhpB n=1 Tax=Lactiplantibacillus pentosus TaxID=1589 RepID=A0ABD7IU80_LACPE|nr:RNA-binding cell elongation regulator Jag/EloR [Lactiplantibacillus pentosus]RMW50262.1 protein jag [Lactiplantibacillus pentosus]